MFSEETKKPASGSEFSPRAVVFFTLCFRGVGLSLPGSPWALDHVKLHRLAFLEAAESIRLNGREMPENIIAGLAADEAEAFGVVEPF
jgi:hypothetical protein